VCTLTAARGYSMSDAMLDARQEGDSYRRIEVITRRRRRWTAQEKARIEAESFEEGANRACSGTLRLPARIVVTNRPQISRCGPPLNDLVASEPPKREAVKLHQLSAFCVMSAPEGAHRYLVALRKNIS
jgi:hypothetical protein